MSKKTANQIDLGFMVIFVAMLVGFIIYAGVRLFNV